MVSNIGPDPLIGKQLGAYLIQSKLGEGGMARVYKAYHARLRRDVAIKVISSQAAHHADFQARFEREAQLIASLGQSNIVAVHDFGEIDNLTYLVMQYVGGGTLRDQLHNGQPLDPWRTAHYALQMARALHHAHQRGIVHRDIKPQNMLVSADDPNHLLLSDFGIAKLFDASQESTWIGNSSLGLPANPTLTSTDQIVGTADYMAPEQINRTSVDARTDVYALGVVLYQMLTGYVPFQSTTIIGLLYQHVNTPPKPIREVNPRVPEVLAQITAKALEKAPEARFQSAEEMARALEGAIAASANPQAMPVIDRYATYGRLPGEQSEQAVPLSQNPAVAHETTAIPPILHTPNTSAYGQADSLPTFHIPEDHKTMLHTTGRGASIVGAVSATSAANAAGVVPTGVRSAKPRRVQTMLAVVLAVVAIAFVVSRVWPFLINSQGGPQVPPTTQAAQSFLENFHDHTRHWAEGSLSGLQSVISNNQYTLTTNSASNAYFPYPATVGTLPARFTLTAQVAQEAGAPTVAYGLTFYLTFVGNQAKSCYAFVITSAGNYAVLRYDNGQLNTTWSNQWYGQSAAIHTGLHQSNLLRVGVKDHTFSFAINDQSIMPNNAATITDSTYADGSPGLYVAGPNTSFAVTSVQLTIP